MDFVACMTRNNPPLVIPDFPDLSFEIPLWDQSYTLVAGIDEAGRGAWAGPVAASAVILPADPSIINSLLGVNDSKKCSASQRERLAKTILTHCLAWGVGMASAREIDQIGILPATHLAAKRAISELLVVPQYLLFDYLRITDIRLPQLSLVKGDARSLSIAAASILAKTSRDSLMREFDAEYPGYGFSAHKGYGTALHRKAILDLGVCPIHRMSFKPLKPTLI